MVICQKIDNDVLVSRTHLTEIVSFVEFSLHSIDTAAPESWP